MLAVVLILALGKQQQDWGMLLSMAVCCMTAGIAIWFLEPVLDFVIALQQTGDLPWESVSILLKAVGIGLVTELAAMVCRDAGQESLAKGMVFLGSAVILRLSVPVFESLLEQIRDILGAL